MKDLNTFNFINSLNESKKMSLNEDLEGQEITSPSGKFYVGDPCYILSDDIYYGVWEEKFNFADGKIQVDDNLAFIVHSTAYGDGAYFGTNGFTYGVDSGTLAVVPIELISNTSGVKSGTIEDSKTAKLEYNNGIFDIILDNSSFSIITSEEEDEDDSDYWDEEDNTDYLDEE